MRKVFKGVHEKMGVKKLYIFNVGSTYDELIQKYGDFDVWANEKIANKIPTKTVHVKTETLPKLSECLGVIVMGSHEMVSDESRWMKKMAEFLKKCLKKEIPILGICFGHQLLAYALGARIDYNPNGLEMGKVKINLNKKGKKSKLFLGIKTNFDAYVSHFQSIVDFPKEMEVLALNTHDKIHAFRYKKNAYGVQFHPEFNKQIMKFYLQKHKKYLAKNFKTIRDNTTQIKNPHQVLINFVKIVLSK